MKINRIVLKISSILLLGFLIIGIGIGLASAFVLEKYYPLEEGNNWIYVVTGDEVTPEHAVKIESKEKAEGGWTVKITSSDGSSEYMIIDTEGIKEYKFLKEDEYAVSNPPGLIFPSIIEIGEERNCSTTISGYGLSGEKTREYPVSRQIKLAAIEDVEVPAGKFTACLKFYSNYEYQTAAGKSKVDCSIWLAPGVGKVKEFCSKFETEDGEKKLSNEFSQLKSAVIDGKEISGQ